jgi:hypothetical protein
MIKRTEKIHTFGINLMSDITGAVVKYLCYKLVTLERERESNMRMEKIT